MTSDSIRRTRLDRKWSPLASHRLHSSSINPGISDTQFQTELFRHGITLATGSCCHKLPAAAVYFLASSWSAKVCVTLPSWHGLHQISAFQTSSSYRAALVSLLSHVTAPESGKRNSNRLAPLGNGQCQVTLNSVSNQDHGKRAAVPSLSVHWLVSSFILLDALPFLLLVRIDVSFGILPPCRGLVDFKRFCNGGGTNPILIGGASSGDGWQHSINTLSVIMIGVELHYVVHFDTWQDSGSS